MKLKRPDSDRKFFVAFVRQLAISGIFYMKNLMLCAIR